MSTTPTTSTERWTEASLDEQGRLVHAEDACAQLARTVTRLEAGLSARGRTAVDLATLEVLTTDRTALLGVIDVLTDRLAAVGATPPTDVREVARLAAPGQLVALTATLRSHEEPDTHEGSTMTVLETTVSPAVLDAVPAAARAVQAAAPGCVHLPGEPAYDAQRVAWNLAVDQTPAAVAVPHTVEDVQRVVAAAAAHGLQVAPQSSGHGAVGLTGRLGQAVLLRLHELTGVEVDAARRVARVTGGTLWRDVVEAAAPHGLTALHGSSPDVAVAGYALGGGLSFYARRHGLCANSLLAVEVVTADGRLVRATADEHAELFWAVRGGGGSFGVVVALELALLPVADVVAGMMLWPLERAPEVVRAWVRWTREVPDSVTTSLRVMQFPPLPELPPFLSGRRIVVVDGALLEDDERAAELLAPLRALAPELDTVGRVPAAALLQVHMDPPGPTPAVGDHAVLGALDDAAVDALLGQVGPGTTTSLMFAELRHLGGALAVEAPGAGALPALPGDYALFCAAVAPVPEAAAAGVADAAAVRATLAPWTTGASVLNFAEQPVDPASAYTPERWERLRAVKELLDPHGAFLGNHQVPGRS